MSEKEDHEHHVFYILIAAFAIIALWRGLTGVMDIFLFPDNKLLSDLISLLLGLVIIVSNKHLITHLI